MVTLCWTLQQRFLNPFFYTHGVKLALSDYSLLLFQIV